jgi:hypothetical protein
VIVLATISKATLEISTTSAPHIVHGGTMRRDRVSGIPHVS